MQKVYAPTVRHVLGKLTHDQLRKAKEYSRTNKFSHSWYWHGPAGDGGMDFKKAALAPEAALTCNCVLAAAFNVARSIEPGNFWGAKVDDNLMRAMGHLSEASGGDVGSVNFILEMSKLSHDELVSILDDSLSSEANLREHVLPQTVHDEFLNRKPPQLKSQEQAPTVRRVLSALSDQQLARLLRHSLERPFHHGWYWFGPEGAVGVVSDDERFSKEGLGDPVAVAFDLTPSRDATSWRGCKLDDKFVEALAFWAKHAGGEVGMEDYVTELNSLSSAELDRLIRSIAADALSK